MLSTKFFVSNRRQLVSQLAPDGVVIMTANGLMQHSADASFPFRQDSNFFYLTGSEEPNLVLVIDTKTSEEFLILPTQTQAEKYFGGLHDEQSIAKVTGIEAVLDSTTGWQKLKLLLTKRTRIYALTAPPVQFTRQERMYSSPARRLLMQKLKRISKLPQEPINEALVTLRTIKHPEEIKALKEAITVTQNGIEAVLAKMACNVYEYELEAELDYAFKKQNSSHGFMPPIVAAGKNTTILHYNQNNARLNKNDLLLLDIGAQISNYSADISRTFKVSGNMNARQQAVYDSVMRVHSYAHSLLKPKLSWREYIIAVDHAMGEELISLGLITENTRSAVRAFFPHSISHSLGLDVHDPCDYSKPLQENMVITIEPGIYIPGEGIGVRVEDDFAITKTGAINLSAKVPYKSMIK